MLIKLLSVIPAVNVKNEEKINQAVLQRNLAEIVWYPSSSLCENFEWEGINHTSVKATILYKGTKGTGTFYFDKNGLFKRFETWRFKDVEDSEPTLWIIVNH